MTPLSDQEFVQFQNFIYDAAGISMSSAKKALIAGRLVKRVQHYRLASFGDYFRLLSSGNAGDELQTAVDLLTTNETYFFREPKHFDFLQNQALPERRKGQAFRVWSAASSTGEEAYSIAMLLADCLEGESWEVLGSDVSTRVLTHARTGLYPVTRTRNIPPPYLKRFCLRGVGPQEGTVLVERNLRAKVQFMQVNLNTALPQLGSFDVIFLRNVMIYFNADTKKKVVSRVLSLLKPNGYFIIGHSESLHGVTNEVQPLVPSIYRKA